MSNQWFLHNSHETFFRCPFGAVACGEKITLRLLIHSFLEVNTVYLRLWRNNYGEEKVRMVGGENQQDEKIYLTEIDTPNQPGLVWYYFIIETQDGKTYYYGNNSAQLGGIGEVYQWEPPSYQITVHKENNSTPSWFKDAIMYQIFVDRFYNGYEDGKIVNPKENSFIYTDWWEDIPVYRRHPETGAVVSYDFFGGNLLGVLKKLPYLKELGVNVLYLNPIFEAPSNHKYDTADYHKIDSMFGDNELFQKLCQEAKEMGIYLLLDGVFSHTGSDSIYFNKDNNYSSLGAYQSKDSPYYSWYRFEEFPDKYQCWWGIDTLPNVEELEPSYLDFVIKGENSVVRHWLRTGIKGWRLDVVDELPDEFLKDFRTVMKKMDSESILLGEVWEDASHKISYSKIREYLLGEELDSTMNYPFRKILLDFFLERVDALSTHLNLMSLYENYPRHHFYSAMNLIGSHDVPRILTLLGEAPEDLSKEEQAHFKLPPRQRELALARLKLMVLWQMTFPGVPCIYYGDEAGLEGYTDPLNRRTYPWGRENQELLSWHKGMVKIRNDYAVLRTGEWFSLYAERDVYGYARRITGGRDIFGEKRNDNLALIFFNRHQEAAREIELDLGQWCPNSLIDLLNNKEKNYLEDGKLKLCLEPLGGKILVQKDEDNET